MCLRPAGVGDGGLAGTQRRLGTPSGPAKGHGQMNWWEGCCRLSLTDDVCSAIPHPESAPDCVSMLVSHCMLISTNVFSSGG